MKKRKISFTWGSPYFFALLSLGIILIFSVFVLRTMSDLLEKGMVQEKKIAYEQYEQREQVLAKDGVVQLILGIEYALDTTSLDSAPLKEKILDMVKRGGSGRGILPGILYF